MNNKEFEPIRIRIMQEAYELADRGDVEGYNAVKVMCDDVQNLLKREWVGLTDEDMGFLFPHGKSVWVQEIVKIIENKLKEKNFI